MGLEETRKAGTAKIGTGKRGGSGNKGNRERITLIAYLYTNELSV